MIYFIQTTCERGFVKIGTAINFRQRLAQIQKTCPYRIKVVRTLPGGQKEERGLHQRFAASRERGEWFNATDDLVAYINETAGLCLGAYPVPEVSDLEHNLRLARVAAWQAKQRVKRLEARGKVQ